MTSTPSPTLSFRFKSLPTPTNSILVLSVSLTSVNFGASASAAAADPYSEHLAVRGDRGDRPATSAGFLGSLFRIFGERHRNPSCPSLSASPVVLTRSAGTGERRSRKRRPLRWP